MWVQGIVTVLRSMKWQISFAMSSETVKWRIDVHGKLENRSCENVEGHCMPSGKVLNQALGVISENTAGTRHLIFIRWEWSRAGKGEVIQWIHWPVVYHWYRSGDPEISVWSSVKWWSETETAPFVSDFLLNTLVFLWGRKVWKKVTMGLGYLTQ